MKKLSLHWPLCWMNKQWEKMRVEKKQDKWKEDGEEEVKWHSLFFYHVHFRLDILINNKNIYKILINNRAGPPDWSWGICPGPVLPDGRASHVLVGLVPGHIVTDHFWYKTGSGRGGPIGPPGFCSPLVEMIFSSYVDWLMEKEQILQEKWPFISLGGESILHSVCKFCNHT